MADIATIATSVASLKENFEQHRYICSDEIATAVFLAYQLRKPVLIEGPPGVGKTELAKTAAKMFSLPLVRLQCYEGLDESKALYEWKYGKQLLYTQLLKDKINEVLGETGDLTDALGRLANFSDMFFSEQFLEPRPLLQALREPEGAVLLIDEVDKANEEFEAFLLEILSAFQVTIPEIGTITAARPPLVFLTSNNTRDMSDALKRRCLHLHIPLPDARLEAAIVTARVPGIDARLTRQVVAFVQALRALDLKKLPSISETLDWARAIVLLHGAQIDRALVRDTLNVLLKFEADIDHAESQMTDLLRAAEAAD